MGRSPQSCGCQHGRVQRLIASGCHHTRIICAGMTQNDARHGKGLGLEKGRVHASSGEANSAVLVARGALGLRDVALF